MIFFFFFQLEVQDKSWKAETWQIGGFPRIETVYRVAASSRIRQFKYLKGKA
jgi:hypothetical protein